MPFLKDRRKLSSRCQRLENMAKKHGLRHTIFKTNGCEYLGEWNDDFPGGQGSMLTPTLRLYEGSWKSNYRHGFGVFCDGKGDRPIFFLHYRGEWKKEHFNGFGERHYLDGGYYKGYWKNSKRHGFGQMWYVDGSFYHGNWAFDLKHGEGMLVRADGNRYEGEWARGLKHGRGRFFHLDNGQFQEGIWEKDVCKFSVVEDLKFRQTSVDPTPYPIRPLELQDIQSVIQNREKQLLAVEEESTESEEDEEEV